MRMLWVESLKVSHFGFFHASTVSAVLYAFALILPATLPSSTLSCIQHRTKQWCYITCVPPVLSQQWWSVDIEYTVRRDIWGGVDGYWSVRESCMLGFWELWCKKQKKMCVWRRSWWVWCMSLAKTSHLFKEWGDVWCHHPVGHYRTRNNDEEVLRMDKPLKRIHKIVYVLHAYVI